VTTACDAVYQAQKALYGDKLTGKVEIKRFASPAEPARAEVTVKEYTF
jgi:hypothetical protein